MKYLIVLSFALLALTSCKTGWSVEDQQQYINDCMAMAAGVENAEAICDCGLQKAMDSYESKEQAERAIQKMTEEELQKLFAECM
ncbi:MAG: hypothetical protein ACR2MS_08195 [Weeksellaceae bacterium]